MTDLLDNLTTLLAVEVNQGNQVQHNTEVEKLREEIARAKKDPVAENARMTVERAVLDAQAQRI